MTDETADWCVLTQTRAGKVSLIKGLTAGEARETARRATPHWRRPRKWTEEEETQGYISSCTVGDDRHEIDKIEVFRGTGETMDYFKGWAAS